MNDFFFGFFSTKIAFVVRTIFIFFSTEVNYVFFSF